jgi:hypothetical protein
VDVFELRDREAPIAKVCDAVEVSPSTLYQYMTPDGMPRQGRDAVSVGTGRKRSPDSVVDP